MNEWMNEWMNDWLIEWVIELLIDWMIDWLKYWLAEWSIDRVIDWLIPLVDNLSCCGAGGLVKWTIIFSHTSMNAWCKRLWNNTWKSGSEDNWTMTVAGQPSLLATALEWPVISDHFATLDIWKPNKEPMWHLVGPALCHLQLCLSHWHSTHEEDGLISHEYRHDKRHCCTTAFYVEHFYVRWFDLIEED